jgi:hypothetical protein
MMYLLCQLDGDLPGYPREQFEEDIVNECEKDIRSCFAAGAAHVVMDLPKAGLRRGMTHGTLGRHAIFCRSLLNSITVSLIAFRQRSAQAYRRPRLPRR